LQQRQVKGKWVYLYRSVDDHGDTIDFYLSKTRNSKAAKLFLKKSLRKLKEWEKPQIINTDKNPAYVKAIKNLKKLGLFPNDIEHQQVKFHNNIIESDHGKLKRLIKPTLGFKSMKSAYATIKGFEVMRIFKKGQMDIWKYGQGIKERLELLLIIYYLIKLSPWLHLENLYTKFKFATAPKTLLLSSFYALVVFTSSNRYEYQ